MDTISEYDVANAMVRYGGGFAEGLGRLYFSADDNNRAKIKAAWPELWAEYRDLARLHLERKHA